MNNLLKVLFVIVGVIMLSAKVLAEEMVSQEGVNIEYERVLQEFEQMKVWYPEEDDHKVKVSVFSRQKLSSQEAFDFFIDIIRTMPEGSYNDFRYYDGSINIKVVVNRAGADYLYSLGTVSISPALFRIPAQPNR